jgi:hypothetical protein
MEDRGADAGWGKPLNRLTQLSGSPTSRDNWEQVGEKDERSENFSSQSFNSHLQVIFIRRKTLQHGASSFTFHSKEAVLMNFIVLKNP